MCIISVYLKNILLSLNHNLTWYPLRKYRTGNFEAAAFTILAIPTILKVCSEVPKALSGVHDVKTLHKLLLGICLFHSSSHMCTVELSRGYMMCDIATDWIRSRQTTLFANIFLGKYSYFHKMLHWYIMDLFLNYKINKYFEIFLVLISNKHNPHRQNSVLFKHIKGLWSEDSENCWAGQSTKHF